MPGGFNPDDMNSWYFGPLSREDTNTILMAERDSGVFLVRDSSTIRGDYVLCVKEDNKVSHYIINKIQISGSTKFRIGDQEFPDLSSLLNFYKTHYLDTTSLIKVAPRERYIAKYDFPGKDPEDLPFKKGEILTILQKDELQWWTARNTEGAIGCIPVPYIQKFDAEMERQLKEQQKLQEQPAYREPSNLNGAPVDSNSIAITPFALTGGKRNLPAKAVVIQQRIPNAYDKTALKLEVGEEILVTKMDITGQWEGEINNRKGHFPFTHIQFVDTEEEEESTGAAAQPS